MKIEGRKIAQQIFEELKIQVSKLKENGITPTLAVILMGDNESSATYVKQKQIKAEEIGAKVQVFQFDKNVSNEEIESLVKKLDSNPQIHGIILQRPTPSQIKTTELEELISPKKEVDGFGANPLYPVPVAEAVYKMLLTTCSENQLQTKQIVVLGKGETAGMPIINYLKQKGTNPSVIDSKTVNREELLKNADIVISAVGKENVIKANDIKKGTVVIGVGLGTDEEGKLKGDFNNNEIEQVASFYSPTPGGVGPVNVAILMENLIAATKSSKLPN